VVVTHHPDSGFAGRVTRVHPQVGALVIVDNGSHDAELGMLRELAARGSVALLCNRENLGVAHALNVGVQRALAGGYSWALLLDQDTLVDPDMVERLLEAQASCPDGNRVAAVGSRVRDPTGRSTEPLRLDAKGEQWEEVESVITSGSLLSLPVYAALGGFRDEFFIDYVDTEYCFRARAAGYRIIETLRPLMSHTVGAPTPHKLLWSTTWTSNHSADRRYYIARNNTVLLREYGTSGRGPWQLKSIVRCLRLCKRIAYYEQDKFHKIAAVGAGWWDGIRGKMGPRRMAAGKASTAAPRLRN
jgi:rhamnosyltransferase